MSCDFVAQKYSPCIIITQPVRLFRLSDWWFNITHIECAPPSQISPGMIVSWWMLFKCSIHNFSCTRIDSCKLTTPELLLSLACLLWPYNGTLPGCADKPNIRENVIDIKWIELRIQVCNLITHTPCVFEHSYRGFVIYTFNFIIFPS